MAKEQKVGGAIRAIEWDRTGERLAITFSGEEAGTELIALYATRLHPFLQFTPRCNCLHRHCRVLTDR